MVEGPGLPFHHMERAGKQLGARKLMTTDDSRVQMSLLGATGPDLAALITGKRKPERQVTRAERVGGTDDAQPAEGNC